MIDHNGDSAGFWGRFSLCLFTIEFGLLALMRALVSLHMHDHKLNWEGGAKRDTKNPPLARTRSVFFAVCLFLTLPKRIMGAGFGCVRVWGRGMFFVCLFTDERASFFTSLQLIRTPFLMMTYGEWERRVMYGLFAPQLGFNLRRKGFVRSPNYLAYTQAVNNNRLKKAKWNKCSGESPCAKWIPG